MTKETLLKLTYGMYIVASRKGDRFNGLIINTATQVTARPPTVAVCISRDCLTHGYIEESGVLSISMLKKDTPLRFIGNWGWKSGRDVDKFKDARFKIGQTGAPIVLDNAFAYLELKVTDRLTMGTHTIFVGEVVAGETFEDAEPLTYSYYRDIKGGRSSKYAPTYDGWGERSGEGKDAERLA